MSEPVTASGPPATSNREANKIGAVAVLAASVEWYDFFIFGSAAALVFASQYFPEGNATAATLSAFATFAVGFAARPIGGIVAGNLGDRIGRIPVLVLALVVMGVATALIGLLPTYASIGIAAPVLLVLLRIAQGLAVGAQWGGAVLLATEYAPPEKRGLFGSLVQLGVPIGLIGANVTFLVLAALLSEEQFLAWGWRIAFVPSLLIVALGLWVRRNVPETPDFQTTDAAAGTAPKTSPVGEMLRKHWRILLMATGSVAIVHALFYTMITGLLEYAARPGAEGGLGMESSTVLTAILVSSVFQLGLLPLFARISDRIGRVRMYRIGATAVLVAVFPMLFLIEQTGFWAVFAGLMLGSVALSMIYGPQAALFSELFSPEVRYSGASTGYQLGAVVGGGLAPFILVLVVDATGSSIAMGFYLGGLALLSLLCIFLIGRSDAGRRVGEEEAARGAGTARPARARPASPSS